MRVKLRVDLQDGRGEREMVTNMLAIVEWEKLENRRSADGKGIGFADMCCWAYVLCKLAGDKVPGTWREWVAEHPDMTIIPVEETTDETPTIAAPGDAPSLRS
jgi:hypothetical protein